MRRKIDLSSELLTTIVFVPVKACKRQHVPVQGPRLAVQRLVSRGEPNYRFSLLISCTSLNASCSITGSASSSSLLALT